MNSPKSSTRSGTEVTWNLSDGIESFLNSAHLLSIRYLLSIPVPSCLSRESHLPCVYPAHWLPRPAFPRRWV